MKYANGVCAIALILAITSDGNASQVGLTDCQYEAKMHGGSATLTVTGGEPTGYIWKDFTASHVWLDGNTIHIDRATIEIKSVTANSFSGKWRYGSDKRDLTFKCRR